MGKRAKLGVSFLYFFALLASYSMLRPLRDEMAVKAGLSRLPWLFTGTFAAIAAATVLFARAAGRWRRGAFVPAMNFLFAVLFFGFALVFRSAPAFLPTVSAFYVSLNVFSLFAVSISWSLMSDLFDREAAKKCFGVVSAGGSAGALAGPAATAWLAPRFGPEAPLSIAAALLLVSAAASVALLRGVEAPPIGGGTFRGISRTFNSPFLRGIAAVLVCTSALSTVLYFAQAEIVARSFSTAAERTHLFASIDLGVNSLAILLQLFAAGPLIRRFGVGGALSAVALLVTLGFAGLAAFPGLPAVVVLMVAHRAGHFAIGRPARELLFVSLDAEARYKAKCFIDTIVYRGSDASSAWLLAALHSGGVSTAETVACAVPLGLAWAAASFRLGRRWERREAPWRRWEAAG